MLLFIYISGTDSASFVNFKTSYVIVYTLLFLCSYFRTLHFKTSYVIVYHSRQLGKVFQIQHFKTSYVIVYPHTASGSVIGNVNFKTSYVIVYRITKRFSCFRRNLFQNILCYCLSILNSLKELSCSISKHLMLLFIFCTSFKRIS